VSEELLALAFRLFDHEADDAVVRAVRSKSLMARERALEEMRQHEETVERIAERLRARRRR